MGSVIKGIIRVLKIRRMAILGRLGP